MFQIISSMAIYSHCYNNSLITYYNLCDSVIEHPHLKQVAVGSNPGRAIPGALKVVPVATLLGAQHYKARLQN